MQIVGLDFGNYNTKTSEGVSFQSKICKDEKVIKVRKSTDENLMVINNEKLLVGEGEFQTEANKLEKDMFKACILKALALSSSNEESMGIVLGIPAVQYNSKNKDKLKNELLSDKIFKFNLAGIDRNIILEDVEVFPESAGAYYSLTNDEKKEIEGFDLVLVNLGGGNTNIGYFKLKNRKRKLVKSDTIMSGILDLYQDFISAINGEWSLKKDIEDAENILKHGLYIYGGKQDLSFTKDIIMDHINKIFKKLNSYPIQTSKVMFTGGASRLYAPILKMKIPGCLFQRNYLTSNAEGFKRVGEALWGTEYQ